MKIACVAWLGLAASIGLAGCTSTQGVAEAPSLDGSAWVLSSMPGRILVADATPTARFEHARVDGSDGCNRYSMPFKAQGSTIEIGPMGPSTQMACPESTMAQAQAFTAALRSTRSFRRDGGSLNLLDASGAVVASFASQTQSLAGTSWNVMNINNGREAIVGIVSGSTVTMVFDADGRVSGSTGCNQFTASYSIDGDALRFSPAAATRRACADPAVDEQEQAFLRAFESVATMRFEGARLDLRSKDGALAIVLFRQP